MGLHMRSLNDEGRLRIFKKNKLGKTCALFSHLFFFFFFYFFKQFHFFFQYLKSPIYFCAPLTFKTSNKIRIITQNHILYLNPSSSSREVAASEILKPSVKITNVPISQSPAILKLS